MSISNEALQKVSFILYIAHNLPQEKQNQTWTNRSSTWQLVQEIEAQALLSQQQINVVKTQVSVKQRDIRLLELTSKEVSGLPRDTNIYEGVGKMYDFLIPFCFKPRQAWLNRDGWRMITSDVSLRLLTDFRFVSSPIDETDKRLSKETAELKLEIQNLGKKLHYLETTHKNSREHIDQIFNSAGRGWRWSKSRVGVKCHRAEIGIVEGTSLAFNLARAYSRHNLEVGNIEQIQDEGESRPRGW